MKLGLPKIAPLNRPGADKDIDRALKKIEQALSNLSEKQKEVEVDIEEPEEYFGLREETILYGKYADRPGG